jgi:hypothetical protein
MFHETYAAGGHGFVPYWLPNTAWAYSHGNWFWVDTADNLLVVHATGTTERGRSHAMVGGQKAARFRLGSAWDVERDNQHVTIPRTTDALVLILPDVRWRRFPLRSGQAAGFMRSELHQDQPSANLLPNAGALLDANGLIEFEAFLNGYTPPEPISTESTEQGAAADQSR